MDGRKNNKGTKGNKGGRPPKRDEQKLIEMLSPMEQHAREALNNALKNQESWAVKLWVEYMYGKPLQRTENKHELEEKNIPEWMKAP